MTSPNNPAARVAAVIDRANPFGRTEQEVVIPVWAAALDVPAELDGIARSLEVARLLGVIHQEIELARAGLARTRLPEASYIAQLTSLRRALSTEWLHGGWNTSVRPHLQHREALVYLRDTAAYLLDDEGSQADPDAVGKLRALLDELEVAAREAADLPDDLRRFVFTLVDALRRALREYAIAGDAPVARAYEQLVWELSRQPAPTASSGAHPVMRKLLLVLAGVSAVIVGADKALSGAVNVVKNVRQIQAELPAVREALGLPPATPPRLLPAAVEVPMVDSHDGRAATPSADLE